MNYIHQSIKIVSAVMIVFALFLLGGSRAQVNAQLRNIATSPVYAGWNTYSMGYRFTPAANGNITALWCYNNQVSTVTLWSDAGAQLRQVSVSCTAGWNSAAITPLAVTAGTYYRVSMSPGNYYQTITVPQTNGNITVDSGWYSTSGQNLFPDTNAGATVYGLADVTFALATTAPVLSQSTHSSITSTTATLGGTVDSDGGASVTARGTCWGTTAAPTGNCSSTTGTTGAFTMARSGLPAGTLIYYRAYATNSQGTSYGPDGKFYTPASGQSVAIGSPASAVDSALGAGSVAYTNPSNATTSNNSYATATLGASGRTRYILGTNFGFAIPAGATIDGIVVEGEYKASDSNNIGMSGQLTKNGSSLVGNSKGTAYGNHSTEYSDYLPAANSKSDLWGTTWTSSEINASTFGVGLDTTVQTTGTNVSFDSMRILVYYTPASTPVLDSTPSEASISYTSATLGGNITSQGASAVTERGVCYSTTDNTPQLAEGGVTCQTMGSGTGIFSASVGSLTANTLYYYRAYGTNGQGTAYTNTDNFTTLAIPTPTVSLSAPANLTSNSVRLNASINPQNFATTGYFRIWKINPYNCVDFGDTVNSFRAPIAGGTNLTGSTSQAYFVDVTGLEANKTYYYCAIGDNGTNKGYHSTTPSSFTTPNGPQTSCDVSPTSAITLSGGSVNCAFPGANNITGADGVAMTLSGGATLLLQSGQTVVFTTISKSGAYINKIAGGVMRKGCIYVKDTDGDGRYDPTTTTFSATCPNAVLAGQGFVRRKDLVGAPSYLSQASECNDGSASVTAASCVPGGLTPSGVTNLAGTTVTLNGSANPNGDAGTRAYFKWGPSNTGDCDTLASSTSASLITGTTSQAFSQGISGLTGGNTYYWCTVVYNNSGTSYGDISSFVALSAPTNITFSGVTQTNITVNWTPSTGAQGYKIYRCLGAGCSPTAFLANDADNATPHADSTVSCGNTYKYQITATSGAGGTGNETVKSTISADQPASSCVGNPTLNSPTATSITGTSATLGGTITSNGGAALNARGTCWSTSDTDPRIGDAGVNCAAEGGTTVAAFSHSRTGLPSSSTIYYTAYATNTSGFTGYTTATSFSTPALLANGSNCSTGSECASGNCYVDADNDRYYPASGTATCRASSALGSNDCDDTTNTVNPGVTAYSTTPVSSTGPKNGTYDFNCVNGNETNVTALGLWSDYPGSITCKSGSDQGGYNGTLYGAASPNSGSCTYGSSSYNGRICSNVKGTNATCGEYYATGTSATGWWHISSSCWGSSYKKVTGTVGCR